MTRFARAKGSKASNERVAEEATSWHEMKQQLLEKKKQQEEKEARSEANKNRMDNYKKFLEERDNKNGTLEWTEFPDAKNNKKTNNKIKKNYNTSKDVNDNPENNNNYSDAKANEKDAVRADEINSQQNIKQLKKKRKKSQDNEKIKKPKAEKSTQEETNEITDEKNNKTHKKAKVNKTASSPINNNTIKADKPIKKPPENLSEEELKKIEKKKQKRLRQQEKRKKFKAEKLALEVAKQSSCETKNNDETNTFKDRPRPKMSKSTKNAPPQKAFDKNKTHKKIKDKNSTDYARRKPDNKPTRITVNGKDIDLAYFDGFPIKKEDYEHLKMLRKQMISKGLPRSEINNALKLERRKAEKALAREKKKVCFNCRKTGHNLSECPELNNSGEFVQTNASGICFKCGSTEHTHFECKVVRGEQFKFAKCFVCNEQGHIARQCPDNARGLYPKGGACKLCGDVTHFKKDCPKMQVEKEKDNFVVETIDNHNIESLEGSGKQNNESTGNVIKPKHIRF